MAEDKKIYWLNVFGEIESSSDNLSWERELKKSGNYFDTFAQALRMREKIKEILNESAKEDPMGQDRQ